VVHARAPEAVPDALLRTAIELGQELSGAGGCWPDALSRPVTGRSGERRIAAVPG
jgi:hypothetical protein